MKLRVRYYDLGYTYNRTVELRITAGIIQEVRYTDGVRTQERRWTVQRQGLAVLLGQLSWLLAAIMVGEIFAGEGTHRLSSQAISTGPRNNSQTVGIMLKRLHQQESTAARVRAMRLSKLVRLQDQPGCLPSP